MDKPSGKDVAQDLIDMVNVISGNSQEEQDFIDTILRSHRTLQQSTCGLLLKVFKGWADMKEVGFYDLRNEATVTIAEKITKAVADDYLPLV